MNINQTSFWMRPLACVSGLLLAALITCAGCATMPNGKSASKSSSKKAVTDAHSELLKLREGDVVKITFPGSANLDTVLTIRRDGKINLPLVGEVDAAGLTPDDLQKKLIDLYASQISTKEVTVQVQSSSFPVFVTGSVIHPGKIMSDHPLTALEAVMEAGGFDYNTANMKAVRIVRNEKGVMRHFTVNLKTVLAGDDSNPFYLQPDDIVYVPERFSVF